MSRKPIIILILTVLTLLGLSAYAQEDSKVHRQKRQTTNNTQKKKPARRSSSSSSSYSLSNSMELENFDPRYSIIHYWNSARNSLLAQVNTIIHPLQEQYKTLSPKVKFTTGTLAGFVSTKVVLGAAFKVIKLAGAAYLISEILNYMGLLEETSFPKEGIQLFWKARAGLVNTIQQGREVIQKQMNVETLQTCMERDHMTTIGFVTGIVTCLVI